MVSLALPAACAVATGRALKAGNAVAATGPAANHIGNGTEGGSVAIGPQPPIVDPDAPRFEVDSILVRFQANVDPQYVRALRGASVGDELGLVDGLFEVNLAPGVSVSRALSAYRNDPRVKYAEPNYLIQTESLPNDPLFGQLWGLNNTTQTGGLDDADIDAPEAWDIATGSSSVLVAIIDTGIDASHPSRLPPHQRIAC